MTPTDLRQLFRHSTHAVRSLRTFRIAVIGTAVWSTAFIASAQPATNGRTPWGHPDLQGVWDFRTITPLERPSELAETAVLTAEEAAAYQTLENRRQNRDLVDPTKGGALFPPESQGGVVPHNEFWYDRGTTLGEDRRTSLIMDPPHGRLPARRPGVLEQIGFAGEDLPGTRPVRHRAGDIGADGPEDRGLGERCLHGFNSGPPPIPSAYNNI